MSREWKPGDVAEITFNNCLLVGKEDIVTKVALRTEDSAGRGWWAMGEGRGLDDTSVLSSKGTIRALAVVDPDNPEHVANL